MKERNEFLNVFGTLSPDNQAILLRCAKIAKTAEEAAKKAAKRSSTLQDGREGASPRKEE